MYAVIWPCFLAAQLYSYSSNTGLMDFTIFCWLALCATSVANVIEVDNTNGSDTTSCYQNIGVPCKTLDYALNGLASSTTIMIHEGVYNLTLTYSFNDFMNVTICGAGSNLSVIKCNFGTGLGFFNIKQFALANFTLVGGGRFMNTPSLNNTAKLRVALYLEHCSDVIIEGLVVINSSGSGLIMSNAFDRISIIDSIFKFNEPLKTDEYGDGGASFFLTNITDASYVILNCTFYANVAKSPSNTDFFSPTATAYRQFGHGGGLNFMMREDTHNIAVVIKDCSFVKNRAVWGGGLSIGVYDQSSGHQIVLDTLLFDANCLPHDGHMNVIGTGGGAVRITIVSKSIIGSTNINFTNCIFQNNAAIFGGGVSIELLRKESIPATFIGFINCTWQHNIARLGSALDAYVFPYPFGKVANLTIDSCSFINNTNDYTDLSVKFQGIGTIYLWSVPVFFNGKNTFLGNYGSALVGIDTWCEFQNGAIILFENNTAINGGAITLFNSFLIFYENVQLNFTYNQADGKGGAIYVVTSGQRDLVTSQFCFVSFHNLSVSPYDWKQNGIKVYFGHNKAKFGNSIFATTLYGCTWGVLAGLNEIPLEDVLQVCYWDGTFMYEGVSNVSDLGQEISTDAANIGNVRNDSVYSIPPGKLYNFNFSEENDRMEKVDAVYFSTTNDSSIAVVDDTVTYTLGDYTLLHGKLKSVFNLKMVTDNSLPISVTVKVKLDDCPPGFYLSNSVCKCTVNVPGQDYLGIIECDVTKFVAYLRQGYYAGYIGSDKEQILLTGGCPEGYCFSNSNNSYLELPPTPSKEALDDLICKPKHRTGILCGRCLNNSYMYVNSYNYECGKCTDSLHTWGVGFAMLLGLKYIPMSVFLFIIGLFGISLVDGPLNSAVLFSQLLPYMNIYAGGRIHSSGQQMSIEIFHFVYGMWNLDFLELVTPKFWVLPIQSALEMLLFKNLTPVVIGFMISCLYILISERSNILGFLRMRNSRCSTCVSFALCKCWNHDWRCSRWLYTKMEKLNRKVCGNNDDQSTLFNPQGLITCVVLCYAKLTALAFNLLSHITLYGPGKDDSLESRHVFWLDGTKKFVHDAPWALAVGIICAVLILLIPVIIIFYSAFECRCKENRTKYPFDFCDSIRVCYKQNRLARCFTAVYLFYHIGIQLIYAFTTAIHYQYLWQCGFCLSMLLIHCCVQPYKKRIYNIIDGIMFFILTLISLLSLYQLYAADLGLHRTDGAFMFQITLIYLPFVYIVLLWPCIRYYKHIKNKNDKDTTEEKLIKFIDENLLIEADDPINHGRHLFPLSETSPLLVNDSEEI